MTHFYTKNKMFIARAEKKTKLIAAFYNHLGAIFSVLFFFPLLFFHTPHNRWLHVRLKANTQNRRRNIFKASKTNVYVFKTIVNYLNVDCTYFNFIRSAGNLYDGRPTEIFSKDVTEVKYSIFIICRLKKKKEFVPCSFFLLYFYTSSLKTYLYVSLEKKKNIPKELS